MPKYLSSSHCKHNICYHVILCPKYRFPHLMKYDSDVEYFLKQKSAKLNVIIENIEIMPDHLHMFIKCKTTNHNISNIIRQLKGYASFELRNKFNYLKRYKSFWSSGYYVESIGNISEHVIKKYIDNQKINVKNSYKYKTHLNK